jgi:hypothetical protein
MDGPTLPIGSGHGHGTGDRPGRAAELDQGSKLVEHLRSCGPCRAEQDAGYESAPASR